ncbi:NlpC/P60 family protein [Nitrincola iocasae]|uniref:Glycoside hydrolase n=1 Tax=Nitrincola iocasae TaxID=2614693 RepID=A0A5J6LH87_9GAMM|nr:NlpC/P60 family protein [Nitrincola iocasae]QEW07672.1 glycoside hydrolase [Nitrincola iocasae]
MRNILLLTLLLLLTGCFSTGRQVSQPLTSAPEIVGMQGDIRLVLEQQYQAWAGTPYRLGGDDRQGIDCSALVQSIFTDAFDVQLPRTTSEQVAVGDVVTRQALQPLDLVFFRTGRNQHVGIYLGAGEFLHASTSRGVMISKLDNPYWKRNFWTARRPVEALQIASS